MRRLTLLVLVLIAFNSSSFAGNKEKAVQGIDRDFFLENIWNFEESPDSLVFLGDKPVLIDFYAGWCGPCRIAAPILEDVAEDYIGRVNVYKVNTEMEKKLSAELGVSALPTFLLINASGKATIIKGVGGSNKEIREAFVGAFDDFLLEK